MVSDYYFLPKEHHQTPIFKAHDIDLPIHGYTCRLYSHDSAASNCFI